MNQVLPKQERDKSLRLNIFSVYQTKAYIFGIDVKSRFIRVASQKSAYNEYLWLFLCDSATSNRVGTRREAPFMLDLRHKAAIARWFIYTHVWTGIKLCTLTALINTHRFNT